METVQNFVIYVTDILDCEKDIIMKLGAQVSQKTMWNLPGTFAVIYYFIIEQDASWHYLCRTG